MAECEHLVSKIIYQASPAALSPDSLRCCPSGRNRGVLCCAEPILMHKKKNLSLKRRRPSGSHRPSTGFGQTHPTPLRTLPFLAGQALHPPPVPAPPPRQPASLLSMRCSLPGSAEEQRSEAVSALVQHPRQPSSPRDRS